MFSGAQVSLYPMTDDFVDVILGAHRRARPLPADTSGSRPTTSRRLLVGPPDQLFPAMRDLFRRRGEARHPLRARGNRLARMPGRARRSDLHADCRRRTMIGRSMSASQPPWQHVEVAAKTGQVVAAQFSLYPLGSGHHMDEIYGCIDFLKKSGVFDRSKNFCTKLRGDAGPVFATLERSLPALRRTAGPCGARSQGLGEQPERAFRSVFAKNSHPPTQGGCHARDTRLDVEGDPHRHRDRRGFCRALSRLGAGLAGRAGDVRLRDDGCGDGLLVRRLHRRCRHHPQARRRPSRPKCSPPPCRSCWAAPPACCCSSPASSRAPARRRSSPQRAGATIRCRC